MCNMLKLIFKLLDIGHIIKELCRFISRQETKPGIFPQLGFKQMPEDPSGLGSYWVGHRQQLVGTGLRSCQLGILQYLSGYKELQWLQLISPSCVCCFYTESCVLATTVKNNFLRRKRLLDKGQRFVLKASEVLRSSPYSGLSDILCVRLQSH